VKKRGKIGLAPFAVASDGSVYVNVAHFESDVAVMKIIQRARRLAGMLFIGVAVSRQEKKRLAMALDYAGTDAVAKMVGARLRHARQSRRSSRRSR
jgi:hypothetical protein